MSAATMWAAMQAAIAAVTPYQGNDPVASASYRAAVGQAMCTAIISEQNSPVAWDGTNDRVLDVGQFTKDSFTSATSMPLHIACGDGQVYEIDMAGNFTPAAAAGINCSLNTNNTTYASAFTTAFIYAALGSAATSLVATANSFALDNSNGGIYSVRAKLNTSTLTKQVTSRSRSAVTGTNYIMDTETHWDDTTTVWLSLGTIIMPNAWTGQIVCRRIA